MTDTPTILPPNATALERALDTAGAAALGAVPMPVGTLWRPESCSAALLPWLAWAYSVDTWEEDWPEKVKRDVIAASIQVHRHKGSVGSVRAALAAAGYGEAEIVEGLHRRTYNGETTYNGHAVHGDPGHWATYRVVLERPISNEQADQVRRVLATVAPARSHLLSLEYTAVANTYDGASRYDGAYNHGAA